MKQKESKKASKISLMANINGFFLTVPVNFNEINLHNFLQTKKNWITKTYEYYKKYNTNFGKKYDDKFYLYYLGQKYRVDIAKDVINNAIISSSINKITFHVLNKKNYKKYIKNWYLTQTSIIINERIKILSTLMNVKYTKIKIKDNSTRWGSCSSKGNLNFSLYLVAFPMSVIDYVIIHELAHLKEFNHSKKFWEIVMNMDHDYKEKISYLKKYGNLIIL
ncbi:MAG: M48 family metallopeptidase [Nitrososphaeraceae archaeon]